MVPEDVVQTERVRVSTCVEEKLVTARLQGILSEAAAAEGKAGDVLVSSFCDYFWRC